MTSYGYWHTVLWLTLLASTHGSLECGENNSYKKYVNLLKLWERTLDFFTKLWNPPFLEPISSEIVLQLKGGGGRGQIFYHVFKSRTKFGYWGYIIYFMSIMLRRNNEWSWWWPRDWECHCLDTTCLIRFDIMVHKSFLRLVDLSEKTNLVLLRFHSYSCNYRRRCL